jgi:hypothetical protein
MKSEALLPFSINSALELALFIVYLPLCGADKPETI